MTTTPPHPSTTPADASSEGTAPDTGPLPPEAVPALAEALDRAVGHAFRAANRAGQQARPHLYDLTMSALGGCPRQAAYRLSHTEPSDPLLAVDGEARPALIGTWIHAGLLPSLGEVLVEADIEMPLTLESQVTLPDGTPHTLTIHGTTDCYTRAMGGGVVDLKTVHAYKLGDVDHDGVYAAHRTQVHGYAAALRGWGLPVAWVAWAYLDRSTGESLIAVEPFGAEEEQALHRHLQSLISLTRAVDAAPRGHRGPGLSVVCDGCPWLRRCWGPEAEPGDTRAIAVHRREDIALAAQKYRELTSQISKLEKEKEAYGAMMGRPAPGTYGPMHISYQPDGEQLDKPAARAALELHGIAVPVKPRRGNRMVRWATSKDKAKEDRKK